MYITLEVWRRPVAHRSFAVTAITYIDGLPFMADVASCNTLQDAYNNAEETKASLIRFGDNEVDIKGLNGSRSRS